LIYKAAQGIANKYKLAANWPLGIFVVSNKDMHIKKLAFLSILVMFAACGGNKSNDNNAAGSTPTNTTDTAMASAKKTILFFGNSLTAGYGLDDVSQAFPALIQHKIDSLKLPYKSVNAGNSGETSSGGNGRIDWLLKQPVDVFVLELGANDGLRGIPIKETIKNLQAIVDKVKARYPTCKLVLLGMQVPPNMGSDYANGFKAIFPQLAVKNNMALVPFLLDGVGGNPALNQADGIHPTAEGDKILAENVWKVLKGLVGG
jgi:acyl-CoA thioesterase-1